MIKFPRPSREKAKLYYNTLTLDENRPQCCNKQDDKPNKDINWNNTFNAENN